MKDQAAINFLHDYQRTIRSVINLSGMPEHQRDDMRQEVAYQVILRFRKFGPLEGSKHSSYAMKVTRHVCIDHFRKHRKNSTIMEDAIQDKALGPDELLDRIMRHEHLNVAIGTLSPLRRQVVCEVMAGKSLVDLAEELGRTHTNMKVIHHRALNDLKQRLNP